MRKFWQGWAPEVYAIAFGVWGIICVIVTVVICAPVTPSDRAQQWVQFEGIKNAEVFCIKNRCRVRTSSDTYDLWCESHCTQTIFDLPVKR